MTVKICPIISSGTNIIKCVDNCMLYINGTCAIRQLAEKLTVSVEENQLMSDSDNCACKSD